MRAARAFGSSYEAIIARANGFPPVVGPKGSAQADPITLRAHSCGAALNDGRQK